MTLSSIIRLALPLYSCHMPYHNFGHALTVWRVCQQLIARCQRYGLNPDEEVLAWAALFHDALFGLGYQVKGFATMEEMSASVAATEMRQAGLAERQVAKAVEAIKATHYDVEPKSLEAKILRAADMSNLGADNQCYRESSERLMAELNSHDPLSFFLNSSRLLAHYLHWRIELTPEYLDHTGCSAWHKGAMCNMLADYFESCYDAEVEPAVVMDLNPLIIPACSVYPNPKALILSIEPNDQRRRQALAEVQPLASSELPVELWLPGSSFSTPLPSSSVDVIALTEPDMIRLDAATKAEMARVAAKQHTSLHLKC